MDLDLKKIGTRIRAARKGLGLSQKKLADRLGVTERTVRHWELGTSLADTVALADMSALFGLSTDYLLGISDFTKPENEFLSEQLGISDKATTNLRYFGKSEGNKILSYIATDLRSFTKFMHNMGQYFDADYNCILAEVRDGKSVYYEPVKRPNGENEHRILLGRSAENESGYDKMKCVLPDIIGAAALQDMQAQLAKWKDAFNKDSSED